MFGGDTLAGFRERLGAVLTGDLRLDRSLSRTLAAEAESRIRRGGADALGAVRARLAEWDIDAQWAVIVAHERPLALAEWVEPYLRGVTLVLGCGDGVVGDRLSELDCSVLLCEREHACAVDRRRHTIPFFPFRGTPEGLPRCDSVLVAKAFGCADDPAELVGVAARTRAKRIVVVDTLIEEGCPEEVHGLFGLFSARCLGEDRESGRGERRTLEAWVSAVERHGVVAAVERRGSVPGIPLPHGLFAVDVRRFGADSCG